MALSFCIVDVSATFEMHSLAVLPGSLSEKDRFLTVAAHVNRVLWLPYPGTEDSAGLLCEPTLSKKGGLLHNMF